ncbi:unnamed protein product [Rhizophagus irregularis]|nr:unnamed protein product [Rhizophagus irregularis]CAB5366306.1 unnamed protein product [Rhizophagus irregularis]
MEVEFHNKRSVLTDELMSIYLEDVDLGRIIREDVPKTVISPIKDNTSPNGVINIINTFRREYKLPSKRERDDYVLVLNPD